MTSGGRSSGSNAWPVSDQSPQQCTRTYSSADERKLRGRVVMRSHGSCQFRQRSLIRPSRSYRQCAESARMAGSRLLCADLRFRRQRWVVVGARRHGGLRDPYFGCASRPGAVGCPVQLGSRSTASLATTCCPSAGRQPEGFDEIDSLDSSRTSNSRQRCCHDYRRSGRAGPADGYCGPPGCSMARALR